MVWFNDKGRFSLSVQQDSQVRLPQASEWKTPPANEEEMLNLIRNNGTHRATNIFFRAQSGHSRIRQSQRLGAPYDFRHSILMHKTRPNNFYHIKHRDCRAVKTMGRDIHLVPVEFFYSDPNMLRQYGDRVILFNMHRPETREAFRSARETPNGYILVNEDISTDHIEAVYALEKTGWEFPWTPRTQPRFCDAQGVNVAQNMCSYFSHCYVISNNVDFNDLEPPLRNAVIDAGQYYEQNLRHAGDATRPENITAETPAQQQRSQQNRAILIDDVVQELNQAVRAESKKTQPKAKADPPNLPEESAKAVTKVKPPPACALQPEPAKNIMKAPPKPPPKHLTVSACSYRRYNGEG